MSLAVRLGNKVQCFVLVCVNFLVEDKKMEIHPGLVYVPALHLKVAHKRGFTLKIRKKG